MNESLDHKVKNLSELQSLLGSGKHEEVFRILKRVAKPGDDFNSQLQYASAFKQIPDGVPGLPSVRVAVAASSTVTHFIDVLRFWLARAGLACEIYNAPFNTVCQTILDTSSDLYAFGPDITMIFTNYRDVDCKVEPGSSAGQVEKAIEQSVQQFERLWEPLREHAGCLILQNNADLPDYRVFANFEGTALWSRINVLRGFNLSLAKAAGVSVNVFDIDYLSSLFGKRLWHDRRYWHHAKYPFAPDATGLVAHSAAMAIAAGRGLARKCMVLDLDNTLWGGVVADDGVEGISLGVDDGGEAFGDFQQYLLEMRRRGVVLAVCSKNDKDKAEEPFVKHPDMELRLDDFAVFKANWANKADNIQEIAAELNLGLDSMVFVDDNPAERDLVRQLLPMVSVPEMGDDPADYITRLSDECYFDAVSFSKEDASRSDYYNSEVRRKQLQGQHTDISDYLKSLEMRVAVSGIDDFNLLRTAQLVNKSNQFHLTTTRYTENQIRAFADDPNAECLCFTLQDRFSNLGLISVVILEHKDEGLYIDTWVMSCRVLLRTVEEFVFSEIASTARRRGCHKILGKYIPTDRNQLVSSLYEKLGCRLIAENGGTSWWELDLSEVDPSCTTFVEKVAALPVS